MTRAAVDEPAVEGRQRFAVAAGAALLAAGLVLVMFVLPAEYGVDPLGTGAKLGLLELGVIGQQVDALSSASAGASGQGTTVAAQERPFQQETIEFTLGPREQMEYKYRLEKREVLLYSWSATAPVAFEFHAEPDGAPRGYAETYEKGSGVAEAAGTLTAPFSGIHGWFWDNGHDSAVTIRLTASGFFNLSHEFRKDAPVKNKSFP
jgi:hypothetical protein